MTRPERCYRHGAWGRRRGPALACAAWLSCAAWLPASARAEQTQGAAQLPPLQVQIDLADAYHSG